MNGARLNFLRKGYWLTALAAIVLLAASPGTAQAQVEITGPDEVTEGGIVTYNVAIKGYIQPDTTGTTATVTLETPQPDSTPPATAGEAEDINTLQLGLAVTFDIPAGPDTGDDPVFFSSSGIIRVQTLHDLDAEDDNFTLSFGLVLVGGDLMDAATGGDPITLDGDEPAGLSIEDDETQSYDLTTDDDDAKEGDGTIMVTVTANPAHKDGSETLTAQLDAPRTLASIATPADRFTLNFVTRSEEITITLDGSDGNRDEDTITVTVYSGTAGNETFVDDLSIDIEDANELPAVAMMVVDEDGDEVAPPTTSVTEDDDAITYLVLMPVNKDGKAMDAKEELTVTLMQTGTADTADYTLTGKLTIDAGSLASELLELKVSENDDIGMESLTFDATVSGEDDIGPGSRPSAGVLTLTIEDKTDRQIIPLSSDAADVVIDGKIADGAGADGLNPTESFSFNPSDLFTSPTGYGAKYTTTVSDGGEISETSSGGIVTITALKAGTGTVTVSGTATMAVSSLNASPTQTVADAADITFDVDVVDKPLVVEVSTDPADMVDEGGTVMVIATSTTRAVLDGEDVTVALTVSGPVEGDGHSITIAAGDMMGSTELTVTNDDVVSAMSDVVITATGPGIDGAMVVSLSVTEDDEAPVVTPDNVISANLEADAYPLIRAALGNDPTNTVMNTGDTGTITASELFTVTEGYTASYSVDVVEGDAFVTASQAGGNITVTADAAGDAKVTITGSATMTATSSFDASQDATNIASITFLVMVEDTPLEVTTLTAEPMEIEAGDTSMITATVNRYVTDDDDDVEIALAVIGDGMLDPDSIMIEAGAMSGSAMLTANESVTVVATGSGISGLLQVEVTVTAAPEPVPEPVSNQIEAKHQDVAYPVITAAIALGAGEDEMLTPGESVELMGSDLFTVMDGYDATYRVSVDSAAVSGLADGDSISVTAVSAGDAKVTITGTATMMAASSFDASQDATNVASITFPVTVEAEPKPVVPEPVPALPLIAQWLLGLGLMGGGARQLYRRWRQG